MNNAEKRIDQIFVKVQGQDLPPTMMDLLYAVEVENSLYLPSMCTLRFYDDDFDLIDGSTVKLGDTIEISMAPWDQPQPKTVFEGEITALEPEFNDDSISLFVVRGYDLRHRLNQRHTRTYVHMTDLDIARTIIGQAGIQIGKANSTSPPRDHIFQDNQTDLAFIQMLALRNGFELSVDGKKVNFCKPAPTESIALNWRENLRSFRPRITLAEQVKEVEVRSWDRKQKQSIVEKTTVQAHIPKIGIADEVKNSPNLASSKHTEGRIPIVREEAKTIAQSMAHEIGANYAEAEGTAIGSGSLMPGVSVKIGNVGTRFGGSYTLTSTRHIYTASGYDTEFTIEGIRPQQVSDLVGGSSKRASGWQGVVVGIVTDNNDPEKQNRVLVKFPALTDDYASTWAPVAAVGAGSNRGIQWLPEVNDEVLVAFEFGDINSPFVIGSLWNGKDAPPQPDALANGSTVIRTMQTRVGHVIRMIDADQSGHKRGIEIVDSSGSFKIVIDASSQEITISSGGKINLTAVQDIALSGMNVSVEAKGQLQLEAKGIATLKGSLVNINP